MRKIIRIIIYLIIIIICLLGVFSIYFTTNDYKPDRPEFVYHSKTPSIIDTSHSISILLWNIGFSGLGQEMDFFYDGGVMVRPSKENSRKNLGEISGLLSRNDSVDIILLQEVDINSKRSYEINQLDNLMSSLPEFNPCFATNYLVDYVPVPFSDPMGHVHSGIATFSKSLPSSSVRYPFPGNYYWPKSLFMLDRCFLVSRYPTKDQKELLIINTHNSAYDDGSLKKLQLNYLKRFLQEEVQKENYIIIGGDWNQCPPSYKTNLSSVPQDYMPGWKWVYQTEVPTNRSLDSPFDQASSETTVIDFFLVSPNVECSCIKGIDLHFSNSDHQPVLATFILKGNYNE